jgi:hypothetical protein
MLMLLIGTTLLHSLLLAVKVCTKTVLLAAFIASSSAGVVCALSVCTDTLCISIMCIQCACVRVDSAAVL